MELKEKLALAVAGAEDRKADDIVAMDLRGLSSVTDSFVIISGTSDTHVRAVADGIIQKLAEKGIAPLGTEGYNDGTWILLDYVDMLVHIFHREKRVFYALENLWSDARRIDVARFEG